MKDLPNPDTDTAAIHEIGVLHSGVYPGIGLVSTGQQRHLLAIHPDKTGAVPGGHLEPVHISQWALSAAYVPRFLPQEALIYLKREM